MSTTQNRARLLNCNLTRVLRVAVGSMTRIQEHREYCWIHVDGRRQANRDPKKDTRWNAWQQLKESCTSKPHTHEV
jgi:hypothetical protein